MESHVHRIVPNPPPASCPSSVIRYLCTTDVASTSPAEAGLEQEAYMAEASCPPLPVVA